MVGECVLFGIAARSGVKERRSVRRGELIDVSGVQIMGGDQGGT